MVAYLCRASMPFYKAEREEGKNWVMELGRACHGRPNLVRGRPGEQVTSGAAWVTHVAGDGA